MVALVDLVRLLPAQGVGEGVVELLSGEAVALRRFAGFFRTGKRDLICETGVTLTPSAGAESIDGHAGSPITMIEQDLGEEASCPVAHDDRRSVQLAYETLEVL